MLKNVYFRILTTICLYFITLLSYGYFIREYFSVSYQNFPTWTYNSKFTPINSFTSWDSGFYYDLAQNNYQNTNIIVTKTEIEVPSNSWVKIFLGSGSIGPEKFELPTTKDNLNINNLILGINQDIETKSIPIYYPYEGIGYCIYKGEIKYDRDIKSFSESLINPTACGNKSCDKSYITVFDLQQQKVIYQESYSKLKSTQSDLITGISFPQTKFIGEYQGLGCKTINKTDIYEEKQDLHTKTFTSLAFMPLYPYLVKSFSFSSFDLISTGIFLSLIFFMLSVLIVKNISEEIFQSQNISFLSAMMFTFIPGSFYQFTFLEISQFTFFSLLTIYLTYKSRNLLASITLMLAIYTNIFGVLLLIPLFFINKKDIENLYFFIATSFVILGQSYFLFLKTGDYLAILNSRIPWYNGATTFIGGFYNYLQQLSFQNILEITTPLTLIIVSLLVVYKSKSITKLAWLYLSFIGIILLNGGFSGVIKYIPLISLPFIIQIPNIVKNKKLIYLIMFLCLLINFVFFSFWTLSLRLII